MKQNNAHLGGMFQRFICRCFLIPIILWIIMGDSSHGQNNRNEVITIVEKGFHTIYNFDFIHADSIHMMLIKQYPDHPWTFLYSVNYYWWRIICEKERGGLIKEFYSSLDSAQVKMDYLTRGMDQSKLPHDYLYAYMYIYAFRSRIELLDHKFISALTHTNTCVNYVEQSFGNESHYDPFYLTSGLYYFGTGFTRKKYPWLIPALMLVPPGDTEKGKRFLVAASRAESTIINTEGTYFLMKVFFEFEPNLPVAEIYASILCKKYPQNLLYRLFYIRILKERQKFNEAAEQSAIYLQFAESNKMLIPAQKEYYRELLMQLNIPR